MDMVDIEDQEGSLLPIANVGRIMKQVLPQRAKVSKEAKQTMQECATEFLSFVTSEASDKCRKENRKTVNGDDICWALRALGFDNYAQATMSYLHKYRKAERDKAAAATASSTADNTINQNGSNQEIKQGPLQVGDQQTQTPNFEFRLDA